MASFLSLVNKVLVELNEPELSTSADLSSAAATVGIQNTVKENINKSIRDIATSEVEWSYLIASGTSALTTGVSEYTAPTAANTIDWDSFRSKAIDQLFSNPVISLLILYNYVIFSSFKEKVLVRCSRW